MNRRQAIKSFSLGTASAALLASSGVSAKAAGCDKPTFVLIHGSWHGAWAWNEMTPLLADAGYASIAIDLPGAGSRTRFPASYLKRPIDMDAFSVEPSPIAGITQEERTAATVAAIKGAASVGNGKVILVGHSWGGLTISHAAEAVPELVQSVVYLSAFLLPDGLAAGAVLGHESFSTGQAGAIFIGDPGKHGALRIDPRSQDPEYIAKAKSGFYHDVSDEHFAAIANLLHCDEVISTAAFPMAISAERYGAVDRHYIRMADDRAVPAAAQDHMVKTVDDSSVGGKTTVHGLSGSHSPFFAKPKELLDVFVKIAS